MLLKNKRHSISSITKNKILKKVKIKSIKTPSKKKLSALSLFSGGGGLDLGFAAAGFDINCASDIDFHSCKTLLLNSGKKPYYNHKNVVIADVTKISIHDFPVTSKIKKGSIDIVIGGPPCQAFSVFGKRKGLEDPRGNLVWEYIRIVKEVQPKAFVFENVAGIKTIHNGQLFKDILEQLSINGTYTISEHSYEVADFGIPQSRNRVIIIGTRNGVFVPPILPTHGKILSKPYRTVKEALRFLPEPGVLSKVPNHIGRKHSDRITTRYKNLKYGERDPKTRINKLNPSKPSFTIIVGSDKGGGKGHVHPTEPREVTPRESARIQTFPDWWEFYGTGRHVIRQVGNAVPPLFAALVAEHIKQHVFNEKKRYSYDDFIDLLALDYLKESRR